MEVVQRVMLVGSGSGLCFAAAAAAAAPLYWIAIYRLDGVGVAAFHNLEHFVVLSKLSVLPVPSLRCVFLMLSKTQPRFQGIRSVEDGRIICLCVKIHFQG